MEIETKRLKLVPHTRDFLLTTHEYASDREVTKYMLFHNDTLEKTEKFLKYVEREWQLDPIDFYEFAIMYNGNHIGAISLSIIDDNPVYAPTKADLGWILNKNYWGRGFATEAALAIVELARKLGLEKLYATCDIDNIASYKVMEKIGMRRISQNGVRKNYHSEEETIELKYEMILK